MELSIDGQQVKLFDIDKEEADRTRKVDGVTPPLEVRVQVTAGMHNVGVAFIKKNYAPVEDIFSSTRLRSSISVLDVSRSARATHQQRCDRRPLQSYRRQRYRQPASDFLLPAHHRGNGGELRRAILST